jgi:ADP-ribose pyrophosphatase YjhB (NUDIX family)
MTNGVRILLIKDGRVLLVRHIYEDKWYLPGGLVERGETLEDAIRREAMEEVGAELLEMDLFGVYTNIRRGWFDHISVFISHDFLLSGLSDFEIETLSFFSVENLPEKTSEGSKNRIEDFRNGETKRYGPW